MSRLLAIAYSLRRVVTAFLRRNINFARECKSIVVGLMAFPGLCRNRYFNSEISNGSKVVLLSMGGRLGSPMLAKALFDAGYQVHVIAAALPGYELKYAYAWHRIDVLADWDKIVRKVDSIKPDAILSETRNVLLPIKSKLIDIAGLPSFGKLSALTSNSKIRFRACIDEAKLENLRWCKLDAFRESSISFPIVVKRDRGTGSRGVHYLIDDASLDQFEINQACQSETILVGGDWVVEEFVEGRQFDVEGISSPEYGDFVLAVVEEYYMKCGDAFPSIWYLFNPPIPEHLRKRISEAAVAAVKAAGVVRGAWHCELKLTSDDRLLPIDYSNRMGYPDLVTISAGVSFFLGYANSMLGEKISQKNMMRRSVFQKFMLSPDEADAYSSLVASYPAAVVDMRPFAALVAGVPMYGRISLNFDSFRELQGALERFGLVPDEWSPIYSAKSQIAI